MGTNVKTKANHGGGGLLEIRMCVIFVSGLDFKSYLCYFASFLKIWFLVNMFNICNCLGGWYLLLGRDLECIRFIVYLVTWSFQQGCSHHRCGFKSIILNHFPKISTKP